MSNIRNWYKRIHQYIAYTLARGEHLEEELDAIQSSFEKIPELNDDGTEFTETFGIKKPTQDNHPVQYGQIKHIEQQLANIDSNAQITSEQAQTAIQYGQAAKDIAVNLIKPDGYKYIGRCKSIAELRTIKPTYHGQRILVDAYYEGGTTGGGEFVADLQDLDTPDDGGCCILSSYNTRWKRVINDFVSVVDFGAKHQQDATTAFTNAFEYANSNNKIITSDAQTYYINKPLILSGIAGINLQCKIYGTYSQSMGPIITWMENARKITATHKNFINFVMWVNPVDDSPAIRLAGLKSTNLTIGETGCVQLYASIDYNEQQNDYRGLDIYSLAYNRFDIDILSTLHITCNGSYAWVNENTINTQRFRPISGDYRSGIIIDGDYIHNHNLIRRGCMEGKQSIIIENGSSNTIEDMRFERNPANPKETLNIRFGNKSWSNRIIATWVSIPGITNTPYGVNYHLVNVQDDGIDNVVMHAQEDYSDEACMFELSQTTEFVSRINNGVISALNNNTDINGVRNIRHRLSGKFCILGDYSTIYKQDDYIYCIKGMMCDLSASHSYFRVVVYLFDENKEQIRREGLIESGSVRFSTNSGAYETYGNSSQFLFYVKSDEVKYIKILIGTGNNTNQMQFDYLRFIVRYPKIFNPKSRSYHNITLPKRLRSLSYYNDSDVNMAEIGQGIPCYKHDMSEMRLNLVRIPVIIDNVSGPIINITNVSSNIQYFSAGETTLSYENDAGQLVTLQVSKAYGRTITLSNDAPADLVSGSKAVFLITKVKQL